MLRDLSIYTVQLEVVHKYLPSSHCTTCKYILMSLIIWLICESEIERRVSSFIAKPHVVLSLS